MHAANVKHPDFLSRATAVWRAWLKNPAEVASICPSSDRLVNCIANRHCIRHARNIVDLGPGTGGTTAAILKFARPDCRVLAIEKTGEFIEPIQAIGDPRLIVHRGDAVELGQILAQHQMASPDVIVSGIPFSSLPDGSAESIAGAVRHHLDEQGVFIAYQLRDHVKKYVSPMLGEPETQLVLWNLPPLRIYTWTNR